MNNLVPFTHVEGFSWNTRSELHFLESLWAGKLDYPVGGTPIDQGSALRGYAEGFYRRRNWLGIDPRVIERWLASHSLLIGS